MDFLVEVFPGLHLCGIIFRISVWIILGTSLWIEFVGIVSCTTSGGVILQPLVALPLLTQWREDDTAVLFLSFL